VLFLWGCAVYTYCMKKGLIIGGGVLGLLVLSVIVKQFIPVSPSLPTEVTYKDECDKAYRQTGECLYEEDCVLECPIGIDIGDPCVTHCRPKSCSEFESDTCPLERCHLIKDCLDEDRCNEKRSQKDRKCGGSGYYGQEVECCEGLALRCGQQKRDGSCIADGGTDIPNLFGRFPVCLPCGNGVCDEAHENKCNCPEDCSE